MEKLSLEEAEKEYRSILGEFEAELGSWCDDNIASGKGGSGVWSVSPTIDSLSVIGAVTLAEEKFNVDFEAEEVILKGGYEDIDHFLKDFVPKLQKVFLEKKVAKEKEHAE